MCSPLLIDHSDSIADVIRALGREPNGGLHRWLTARPRAIDAALSHFTGQGWSKGKSFPGPLPLQRDHINGDHADNRLENLRTLCGNCHSQTETWCSGSRTT